MTARVTDHARFEDAVVLRLQALMGLSGGLGVIPNESILHYNGQMDLSGNSMAEWVQYGTPCIVVAIEGWTDEQLTTEGGRHPRSFWETLDVGIYCHDVGLRLDPQEAMAGFDATDRCRGIWDLFAGVRTALTGHDLLTPAGASLGWEGPWWTGARKIADGQRQQLWRLGCNYRGAVEFEIDTSSLGNLTLIHGDLNVIGSTNPPDVEVNIAP